MSVGDGHGESNDRCGVDTLESDCVREVRGRLDTVVEVDEEVLGRAVFRCSSLSFSGAAGLRGDGDEGRESDVARGRGTVLTGDVVRLPGSSFDG